MTLLDKCNASIKRVEHRLRKQCQEFEKVLATLKEEKNLVAKIEEKIKHRSSSRKKKRPKCPNIFVYHGVNRDRSFYFQIDSRRHRHCTADYLDIEASGHKFISSLPSCRKWSAKDMKSLLAGIRASLINENDNLLQTTWKEINNELLASSPDDERLKLLRSRIDHLNAFLARARDADLRTLLENEPNDREYSWAWISRKQFNGNRLPRECQRMWNLVAKQSICNASWTFEEHVLLRRIVTDNGFQNWEKISGQMLPHRSEFVNFLEYQAAWQRKRRAPIRWTDDDNCRIEEIKLNVPSCSTLVSKAHSHFPQLSKQQIRSHVQHLEIISDKRRGFFSKRERFLVNSYRKRGFSFNSIARILRTRTPKQIRDYCRESLTPTRGRWSASETRDLLQAVKFIGLNRWTLVSACLKGRTPTQCRIKFRQFQMQDVLQPSAGIRDFQRSVKRFVKKSRRKTCSGSISQKIELYFLKELQKKATLRVNSLKLVNPVLDLLKFLDYKVDVPAEYKQKLNDYLVSFHSPEPHCPQDFDQFFKNVFVIPASSVRILKSSPTYTNIVNKSSSVLPPCRCSINGYHTFMENYELFVKSKDINFEKLWHQVNSTLKEEKEFKVAKMLWYHIFKATFFWPLKLSTMNPEDLLEK